LRVRGRSVALLLGGEGRGLSIAFFKNQANLFFKIPASRGFQACFGDENVTFSRRCRV
jgi:tRNA G18 (ribose-2'-O)-methylase SpoU